MTPDDILKIFVEQHRLCSPLDPEADPYEELTMNSSMDEWSNANDLLPWQPLSRFLNEEFKLSATEQEWQSILTPSHERTLYDVCSFISNKLTTSNIAPLKLFGTECLSAAIFVTLKKYLQRRNVDVSELKPSSSVIPYLEKHFSPMIEQTTILSKGERVFNSLTVQRKKKGFFNYINIFDKDRYTFLTGDVQTFRDLTEKIIEANKHFETIT